MVKDFSVVYGSPWPPTILASGFIQCGIFAHSSNGVPMHKISRIVLECCAAEMQNPTTSEQRTFDPYFHLYSS